MARTLHKLSDVTAKSAKLKTGRHSDGGGLYLNVSPSGSKSWLFMWTPKGATRREMGLGQFPAVGLAAARSKALACRQAVAEGRDPIEEKQKEAMPTFGEAADKFLDSLAKSWKNEKHRDQWYYTLSRRRDDNGEPVKDGYCLLIVDLAVDEVTTESVLKVLTPIWNDKAETASRLRGRIERVLDFAKVKGWRTGENPALWRGHLKNALPARKKLTRGHHAAMPYGEVPAFMEQLRSRRAMAARALEFTILNASRSGEAYHAQWREIDLDAAVWTLPGSRMKGGREHRVPLSKRAVEILREMKGARVSEYVFPGQKMSEPLSSAAMDALLKRMKADSYTVHGFRSSFRDWAGDETSFPREVAEGALAHVVGNAVEKAYRRSDALEKRRKLLQAWSDYLTAPKANNVLQMRKK